VISRRALKKRSEPNAARFDSTRQRERERKRERERSEKDARWSASGRKNCPIAADCDRKTANGNVILTGHGWGYENK